MSNKDAAREHMSNLYRSGLSTRQIALTTGFSYSTVLRRLADAGTVMRTVKQGRAAEKKPAYTEAEEKVTWLANMGELQREEYFEAYWRHIFKEYNE